VEAVLISWAARFRLSFSAAAATVPAAPAAIAAVWAEVAFVTGAVERKLLKKPAAAKGKRWEMLASGLCA
jgi:hypothetical protein